MLSEQQKKWGVATLAVLVVVIILVYALKKRPAQYGAAGFTSDLDHWPTATSFGNLADTNPYGNYAGHADMHYPTYSE